jgi:hypothetical protein
MLNNTINDRLLFMTLLAACLHRFGFYVGYSRVVSGAGTDSVFRIPVNNIFGTSFLAANLRVRLGTDRQQAVCTPASGMTIDK